MGRRPWRSTAALAVLVGTIVAGARADEDGLQGSQVRVRTLPPGKALVGLLEESTADEMVIRTSGPGSPVRVRRADVVGLEVSRGGRRHAREGLLAGAVAWGGARGQ